MVGISAMEDSHEVVQVSFASAIFPEKPLISLHHRTKQGPRHRTSAKPDSRDVKAQTAIESVHRQFVISIEGGAKDGIVAGLETMSMNGVVSSPPTTAHTNFS